MSDESEDIASELENEPDLTSETEVPQTPVEVEPTTRIRIRTPATDSRRANFTRPSTQSTTTMSNQNFVTIGGVQIPVAATKKVVNDTTTAFYKKADRDQLTGDKLNDLFVKAVSTNQKKYNFIDLKIDDPELLEDTYNLEMAIDKTKSNHSRFDMHDVFTIVDPDDGFKTIDLYKNHANVTELQVAKSNEWYQTMTEDPNNKWFCQNMNLTYEYFTNNVEEKLATKVKETYLKYPPEQRGGPLFFKIMIDILQNSSSEAAQYLISTVKGIHISNYSGENVEDVVSLIRGATSRLENLVDTNGESLIPKDFVDDLIKIFQTTSVTEFNDLFSHYSRANTLSEFITGPTAPKPTISQILKFAEIQYRKLYRSGQWTGVTTKLTETAFITNEKEMKCFNCGGKHHLSKCPVPKSEDRIKANYKLFKQNKKKDLSSTAKKKKGKYSPPTAEEKANNNRRVIDGKEHYYLWKARRWKPVKKDNANRPATNVAESGSDETETNASLADINREKKVHETLSNLKSVLLAHIEQI